MARILTEPQVLLNKYLAALGVGVADRLYIISMLWEEAATEEMLHHIAETKEQDPAELYSIALKIAEKYPHEEE